MKTDLIEEEPQNKEEGIKQEKKNKPKAKSEWNWAIKVVILSFVLSIVFSFISDIAVDKLPIIPALIVLVLVIFIGVIFDIIGVAVTVADESVFHAKATKKVLGSKEAISMIKNSSQVSNLCADVIGDICGVLSGAISAAVAIKITATLGIPYNIQFLISAFVASLTIGGKALGKGFARNYATKIITILAQIVSKFKIGGK